MFRESRPHNCGLSLRVNHSAGLNCLPCPIEGSDQSMDLIRVKRLGVLCEKCAHSLPTGDGKKVAQSLARGERYSRVPRYRLKWRPPEIGGTIEGDHGEPQVP